MTDDEICGAATVDDKPCQNPADENGCCWIPSHQPGSGDDVENPGRPSKFTYKRGHLALKAAREGKSKSGCARAAGVHRSTLDEWSDWDGGKLFGPLYFPAAFAQARGYGEDEWVEEGRGDDGDSSFAKFMLATSYEYEKTEKREVDASHEHTGEGGGPIRVEFNETTVETDWSPPEEDNE